MSLVSLSKYMNCFTYIFLSYQQAGFSEGVLASTKQKSLQCFGKHPGSINHGCWITLGYPRCVFTCELCGLTMTPTWQRGAPLVLLSTVIIGMGVQSNSTKHTSPEEITTDGYAFRCFFNHQRSSAN